MLLIVILLFSVIIRSNYYNTVRTGLETKAKTATDFFSNYVATSYSAFYDNAYKYTESFADSDKLELQFIEVDGKINNIHLRIPAAFHQNTPT